MPVPKEAPTAPGSALGGSRPRSTSSVQASGHVDGITGVCDVIFMILCVVSVRESGGGGGGGHAPGPVQDPSLTTVVSHVKFLCLLALVLKNMTQVRRDHGHSVIVHPSDAMRAVITGCGAPDQRRAPPRFLFAPDCANAAAMLDSCECCDARCWARQDFPFVVLDKLNIVADVARVLYTSADNESAFVCALACASVCVWVCDLTLSLVCRGRSSSRRLRRATT